jgi:hypothetical protein
MSASPLLGGSPRGPEIFPAFFAAHFDDIPADCHLDRIGAEFAVARGARLVDHLCLLMFEQAPNGPSAARAAIRRFSYLAWSGSRCLAEFGRGLSIGLAERGSEMAVAGKTQLEPKHGQIVVFRKLVQSAGEPQP